MTFYNPIQNLNIDYSNSFTLQSGCENSVGSAFNGGFYSSIFNNNFTMPTFSNPFMFNFNMPTFNMSWQPFNMLLPFNFQMPSFNFTMPSFDLSNINIFQSQTPNITPNITTDITPNIFPTFNFTPTSVKVNTNRSNITTKYFGENIPGYNADAGKKLAQIAYSKAPKKFTKKCATYVKKSIEAAGMGAYKPGDGYQMTQILADNKNFKKIDVNSVDYKKLPAGCVLVFNKGAEGYNPEFGHTEITLGDGRAVSDGVTNDIRKPSAIFIPV